MMNDQSSAFWKIGWRGQHLLIRQRAVVDKPRHGQAPAQVHVEVAMHQPHPCQTTQPKSAQVRACSMSDGSSTGVKITRVVGEEADGDPAGGGHADGVPLHGVGEVVVGRVVHRVEVAEPLSDDEEVVAVQVQRVALGALDAGALQHQLHGGVEPERHHPGAVLHERVVGRGPRVVEGVRRGGGEVGEEHAGVAALVVRLEERGPGPEEGVVVDGRRELGAVGALARLVGRARVRAEPHGEEQVPVHRRRHLRRVLRAVQAAEVAREVGHRAGVVVQRQGRQGQGRQRRRRRGVLEDGGRGGVVERALRVGVGRDRHGVGRGGRVWRRRQEHVHGLPRRDDERVHGEWLDVVGVRLDDGERVVCDAEEELVVERGVDEPEHVRPPGLYLQLVRVCF